MLARQAENATGERVCDLLAPATGAELQQIFKQAVRDNRPVYVYRAPENGGMTVSLRNLNRIIEIDRANLVATVEPGVKMGCLAAALQEQGLRFIPADTVFYQEKMLGEFIYEGCSNLSSTKYGIMKHFLMGSEVVLPSGEILTTGGKTVKNVTGYDFTRFFNGPYADLGVTVKYLLKLLPLPEARKYITARIKSTEAALVFVAEMRKQHITPASLVWGNEETLQMLDYKNYLGQLLVLELDGMAEEVHVQWTRVQALLQQHQAVIVEEGDTIGEVAARFSGAYRYATGFALTDEIKFPFTAQQGFMDQLQQAAWLQGIRLGMFGQLADGKINLLFSRFGRNEAEFIEHVLTLVQPAGGFVSGKYQRIYQKQWPGPLGDMEKKLRTTLDPQAILNR